MPNCLEFQAQPPSIDSTETLFVPVAVFQEQHLVDYGLQESIIIPKRQAEIWYIVRQMVVVSASWMDSSSIRYKCIIPCEHICLLFLVQGKK